MTLLLSAFGPSRTAAVTAPAPAPASRLVPAGPPRPQVIAQVGSLLISMPIPQSRLTAIGYHGADPDALALVPRGTQANQGLLRRLANTLGGGGRGGLRYFQIPGGEGPATGELDVGAGAGTDVYSPVDGTIIGVSPYVIDRKQYGSRIDIRPDDVPSIVVSLTHLQADPSLTVGAAIKASTAKVGTVYDFSGAETQALARYTQDAGNHIAIVAHPASFTP